MIDKNKPANTKSNNLLEFYDHTRKGEPYVSRLYTGFDFKKNKDYKIVKPETSWKMSGTPVNKIFKN